MKTTNRINIHLKHSRIFIFGAFLVLALVIVFMLSGPNLFSSNVSFIDAELSTRSGSEKSVRVKVDFGKQANLDDFPHIVGNWTGVNESTEGLKEQLGARTIIKRAYHLETPFQPVFFLLMQSASTASFHPPTVCYPALGYDIEEETKDIVYIKDTTWVDKWYDQNYEDLPEWAKESWEKSPQFGEISVKKLVVTKQDSTERRVVLYLYIKDNKITSHEISMIRVSVIAPPTGSYEAAADRAREFMGEVIPIIFEPEEVDEKMFITRFADMGISGYLIILLLFFIPVGILLYPALIARQRQIV